eukprot:TRINITY_DN7271_c0_g1_i1.p1 TRINITY_DN7271_c0_g1~~TRINITY_DN7271_c0_g1_i1.p1  ORF type:complete len:350 (+),score=12.42 TRINITY_DN7271_c0_g1_i1:82-1131(+)
MSEVTTQDIPATQQIGVGFIGAGIWATNSLLPNILQKPNARIEAVYSRSETSATKFAQNALIQDRKISIYCGEQLADLLKRDDIDVVIIALPIGGQSEIIIQALEHGKCVFSEKPIAATSQDAHKLMELYEQKYASQGLVWFIGENYHFEPAFLYAAEVIKSNRLGTILFGRYLFSKSMNPNVGYYHTKWRRNPQFPGGYFLDQGVHDAAGIRTIFNKKIESVYAQGRLVNADLAPLDTISAIFKFKDQTMLSYDFTFALSEKGIAEHQVFVVGSEGRMTLTRMLKSMKILKRHWCGGLRNCYRGKILLGILRSMAQDLKQINFFKKCCGTKTDQKKLINSTLLILSMI